MTNESNVKKEIELYANEISYRFSRIVSQQIEEIVNNNCMVLKDIDRQISTQKQLIADTLKSADEIDCEINKHFSLYRDYDAKWNSLIRKINSLRPSYCQKIANICVGGGVKSTFSGRMSTIRMSFSRQLKRLRRFTKRPLMLLRT